MHVSLPPLQALGEACTETEWGGGREKGNLAVYAWIGEERVVLYHIAGEHGQRWKNLSSEKQLMWEEIFYLHGCTCTHRQSEGGWKS